MSLFSRSLGGLFAVLAVAGCSGDAATAPERAGTTAQNSYSSNGINVQFVWSYGYMAVGQSCTWEALASGGDPQSHTYTWSTQNGVLEEDYSFANYWAGHGNTIGVYELTVTVTDAYGNSGSATTSGAVDLYWNQHCN